LEDPEFTKKEGRHKLKECLFSPPPAPPNKKINPGVERVFSQFKFPNVPKRYLISSQSVKVKN